MMPSLDHLPTTSLDCLPSVDGKISLLSEIGSGFQSRVFKARTKSAPSANASLSDLASELATDQVFALKVFEKDEFKALGLREFEFLKGLG